ncbi:hypothetical protein JCM33774_59730 [Actinophytocola sp. KF-1]
MVALGQFREQVREGGPVAPDGLGQQGARLVGIGEPAARVEHRPGHRGEWHAVQEDRRRWPPRSFDDEVGAAERPAFVRHHQVDPAVGRDATQAVPPARFQAADHGAGAGEHQGRFDHLSPRRWCGAEQHHAGQQFVPGSAGSAAPVGGSRVDPELGEPRDRDHSVPAGGEQFFFTHARSIGHRGGFP